MSIDQNDIVVHSWSELCDTLYDHSFQPDIGRFRSNYAFRGVSDKDYIMANSFLRNCGEKRHLEYHLLRNFKKYAQLKDCGDAHSDWKWLTIAQHHGLPTRLIDWTYSPFVAMHFATDKTDKFDKDGVIWHVDYVKVNRMLPPTLLTTLTRAGAHVFTLQMLESTVPQIHLFDNLVPEDLVMFFEPPSIAERIINQFAFFSVMSDPSSLMDEWLIRHPEVYRRVIIPAALKWEVRDKLDQANITERMLFPGLDGLAQWLARQYRPIDQTPAP
jgi:hypothetical protein